MRISVDSLSLVFRQKNIRTKSVSLFSLFPSVKKELLIRDYSV